MNYNELRQCAKAALEVIENRGDFIKGHCCDECDIIYAFEEAANPRTILALLDENAALRAFAEACISYGEKGDMVFLVEAARKALGDAS